MAALAPTLPVARLARKRDDELVERFRGGDESAFAEVHDRYRTPLERYAKRVLGDRPPGPEDVVQEVFVKAHGALRADDREIHLRAWLFRLVRNRCLDELRRGGAAAAAPAVPIDDAPATASDRDDPYTTVTRRGAVRTMLEDIAALPERQREVLLRREVDGLSHEQVAADLGITVRASKNLANRAREGLTRRAEARDAPCVQIRDDLFTAHERRRRASAHAYRHVATCRDCRRFRSELGTLRSAMRLLTPGPLLAPLAAVAGGWTALGGGAAGVGTKIAAATAVTAVATGGALEFSQQVTGPGERSPFVVRSAILAGTLHRGERLPDGTALVTRKITLAGDTTKHATVTLPCPPGTRVAELAPDQGGAVGYGFGPRTAIGRSTSARIVFEPRRLATAVPVTVGIVCKRPDSTGSLLAAPAFAASKNVRRVCVRRAYLYETPGLYVVGTVFRGQPVVVKTRDRTGRWSRVVTDAGVRGWVRTSALSSGTRC